MKLRSLLFGSLAAFGVAALPATAAWALQVKVSVNFGPTIVGPGNGTLVVTANSGDLLIITWALGTDTDIDIYRGLTSGIDSTEITRFGGSALELTGQGFDPGGNPNAPFQCTGTAPLSRCSTRGRGPRGRPAPGRGPPRPVLWRGIAERIRP